MRLWTVVSGFESLGGSQNLSARVVSYRRPWDSISLRRISWLIGLRVLTTCNVSRSCTARRSWYPVSRHSANCWIRNQTDFHTPNILRLKRQNRPMYACRVLSCSYIDTSVHAVSRLQNPGPAGINPLSAPICPWNLSILPGGHSRLFAKGFG